MGVDKVAEQSRGDAGDTKGKAEKESRHKPELIGQKLLCIKKYGREG